MEKTMGLDRQVAIRLSQNVMKRLKSYASVKGLPISIVIRLAINYYLDEAEKKQHLL